MPTQMEVEGLNLVLVGSFNPAIFSPYWFSKSGLIDDEDADVAKTEVIHPEIACFSTSWFDLFVDQQRFQLSPKGTVSIRAFDLLLRLFGEVLPHTPVRGLGINHMVHLRAPSQDILNDLGDILAPKVPWGEWGERLMEPQDRKTATIKNNVLSTRRGGLRSITMAETPRSDGLIGHIQTKIEPSVRYRPGLYIETNDHFGLEKGESDSSQDFLEPLQAQFDVSVERSRSMVSHFTKLMDAL